MPVVEVLVLALSIFLGERKGYTEEKNHEIDDRIDFWDVENKNVPDDFTKKYGCKKLTFLLYYNYSIRRCKRYATE